MKKIINGKKYDTDTAKEMGYFQSGCNRSSFDFYEEILYKKKTGEYFLYGNGRANSKYSESCGNECWGISTIIPYTEDEAKKWAEKHLTCDEYESCFGEVDE